jgi:glycosyltransferase involved in cell wall biosynthesis
VEIPLRIGFDAKRLFNNFTGLGNYSRTLVNNLVHYYPEQEYHLFTPKIKRNQETLPFLNYLSIKVHQSPHRFSGYWRTFSMTSTLQKKGIQIYHGLSHEIPVGTPQKGIKSVVTIHDLIYKRHPEFFPFVDRQLYDLKYKYACQKANKIVAVSQATKQDIIELYGIAPEKVEVIYQTCNDRFKRFLAQEDRDAVLHQHHLPSEFMLYVGSIIPRKNLKTIIEAMAILPPAVRIPLVVVGEGSSYKQQVLETIKNLQLQDWVLFPKTHYEELPALYQQANLFLYPSFYEGFGIPILEALYACTPVIAADNAALKEAGGGGAHYVQPTDIEMMAYAMEKIITDANYAQSLADAGQEHLTQFDSRLLSKQLMDLYLNL